MDKNLHTYSGRTEKFVHFTSQSGEKLGLSFSPFLEFLQFLYPNWMCIVIINCLRYT